VDDHLQADYGHCMAVARSHYENFPVASWLMPAELRKHVAVIYTFARQADDLADEGHHSPEARITALQKMGADLDMALNGHSVDDPLFRALQHTTEHYRLDVQLFHDLLDAFMQDVDKTRYESFAEVLDYCRRSANPIGRLMLQLSGQAMQRNNHDSDLICSALQLINFLQDIRQDLVENNRVYLPMDEMSAAGVSVQDLQKQSKGTHITDFIHAQTIRAQQMMLNGAGLGRRLSGLIGLEIRIIINGGLSVCNALLAQGDEVYSRPRLTRKNKINMLTKALLNL